MEKIINYAEHINFCDECCWFESDIQYCSKAGAYNYTEAIASWCPLPDAKPRKAKWQVGGKHFKYYCPICKAEYMNNKLEFCVKCGTELEK